MWLLFMASNERDAWILMKQLADPESLHELLKDPMTPERERELASFLLIIMAANERKDERQTSAREILNLEGIVPKLEPVGEDNRDDKDQQLYYEEKLRTKFVKIKKRTDDMELHDCDKCIRVPLTEEMCVECECANCHPHSDGRDTTPRGRDTYACCGMQCDLSWLYMLPHLAELVYVLLEYWTFRPSYFSDSDFVDGNFNRAITEWREYYFLCVFQTQFTPKTSKKQLTKLLSLFSKKYNHEGLIWRHVSLLLHMQQVLQEKGGDNQGMLDEFNKMYGHLLTLP